MSIYRDQLENFLKTLDIKADRVLDVAGASNPVRDRVRSWDVKEYYILDNELEPRKEWIHYRQDMNEQIKRTPELIKSWNPYDLVFCLELMEYIYDPVQVIKNLRLLCADGGKLIITFPFIYPNHNPVGYDYLRYTKQGAIKLLYNGGFIIDDVIPRQMKDPMAWNIFARGEGYKIKGAIEAGTMSDAGYIIIAHPKQS